MEVFQSILHAAAESGASDIHMKIASPVMFRISGELVSVDAPEPTEAWFKEILRQIVPAVLHERLDHEHEVDLAYDAPGIGRFRVNVFQERGSHVMALRLVKAKIRSFEELCDGKHDTLREDAFMYVGGIDEAVEQGKKLAAEGK